MRSSIFIWPAAAAALSACATVTEGSGDTVNVQTDPPGAFCELKREGVVIAEVGLTPDTVAIEKSKNDVAVRCRRDGYLEGVGVLASSFESMTLGNILLGGVVGVAIDAGSGALNDYPPFVRVKLTPERFSSDAERDLFFDGRRAEIDRAHAAAVEAAREKCAAGEDECEDRVAEADEAREDALAALEADRAKTTVDR